MSGNGHPEMPVGTEGLVPPGPNPESLLNSANLRNQHYSSVDISPATGPPPANHVLTPLLLLMLAIGGTIGTGLFYSVGEIVREGPLISVISVAYVSALVVAVLKITADLASEIPPGGSLCSLMDKFLPYPLALANNSIYCLSWGFTYALELSILAEICRNWCPGFVAAHELALLLAFCGCFTGLNLLPVDVFGHVELWLALVKVVAIVTWIAVVACLLTVKGRYVGPTAEIGNVGSAAVRLINAVVYCLFLFQLVELVAISLADVRDPKSTMPQAVRLMVVRIVLFYVVCVILLVLAVSPAQIVSGESPFLVALANLGLASNAVVHGFSLVIFSAIVLAANSNVYFGSRCLVEITSKTRLSFFARKNASNVPVPAVCFVLALGLFSLLLRYSSIRAVFSFLLTCCASAGLLMWGSLCVCYMQYWPSRGGRLLALFAAANIAAVVLLNGLTVYWDFSWSRVAGLYMTPVLYVLIAGVLSLADYVIARLHNHQLVLI